MFKRFVPIITLVALCWLVFGASSLIGDGHLTQHGIVPRRLAGLPGILWAPFLHSSLKHLAANTGPLLILGCILCARSKSEFVMVAGLGIVLTGGLTWLFARSASHIGASGLVFCLFGYLASMACFRRTVGTLVLSGACLLGYAGLLRGIFPTSVGISWESHLAGLLAGIVLAWAESKLNPPPRESEIRSMRLPTVSRE